MITKEWLKDEIDRLGDMIKIAKDRVVDTRHELKKAEDDLSRLEDRLKEWESRLRDFGN